MPTGRPPPNPIPDHVTIKEVALKTEPTGEWFVSFSVEHDDYVDKPVADSIGEDDMVGVDVGILNYAFTSDGLAVGRPDLDDAYE